MNDRFEKEHQKLERQKLWEDWFISFRASTLAARSPCRPNIAQLRGRRHTYSADHNTLLFIDFSGETSYRTRIAACLATLEKMAGEIWDRARAIIFFNMTAKKRGLALLSPEFREISKFQVSPLCQHRTRDWHHTMISNNCLSLQSG